MAVNIDFQQRRNDAKKIKHKKYNERYLPQRRRDAKKRNEFKGLNLSAFAPWREKNK